jgi:hypothetical protein
MSIIAVDILLKTAIEAGIADLRNNPWLLQDVFNGLPHDKISESDYGNKEVARAVEWFTNNNIPVYLQYRIDQPTFPSITIVDTGSGEMEGQRTSLSDDEGAPHDFDVEQIEKTPQYTYKPFTPQAYVPATGTVTFPPNLTTEFVIPGQFLVSQVSGKKYVITQVTGSSTFLIQANISDDFTGAYIVPPTFLWNQQRELTFFKHSFAIFAAAIADSVQANWLWQVLVYCLLRYKESYLEGRGFAVSTFQSGALTLAEEFKPEMVYYRQVTLIGQCEASWIKYIAPKFQSVTGGLSIDNPSKTPYNYQAEVQNQGWNMSSDPTLKKGRPLKRRGDIDVPVVPDGEYDENDEDGEND